MRRDLGVCVSQSVSAVGGVGLCAWRVYNYDAGDRYYHVK